MPNAGGFIRGAGHLCSFEGDTRVETKRGRIAIKDIKTGDEVLARDDKSGQTAFKPVRSRFLNQDPDTTRLTVRDRATGATQTIVTTSNHPFYVANVAMPELRLVANGGAILAPGTTATGRWVEADRLLAGERLLNSSGGYSEVAAVSVEDTPLDAYNLEVEAYHTFFVAAPDNDNAPAVWVHNACPLPGVPNDWVLEAGRKAGHDKWVNPTNVHDYVRIKPDGTVTQVRNGMAYDAIGNRVPLKSPDAHGITPDKFVFR